MGYADGVVKKALKTCSRCRRNKIKCDLHLTRPGPCTACAKRGVECVAEYVVPHKRSHDLMGIIDGVVEIGMITREISSEYSYLVEGCTENVVDSTRHRWLNSVSKVLKVGEEKYVFFTLSDGTLTINNCSLKVEEIELALKEFGQLVGDLLKLYALWEVDQQVVSDTIVGERSNRYCLMTLFENDELPLLLCLLNFYFDIPGLVYCRVFDLILDEFCVMALEDRSAGRCYDRVTLSKFIVGRKGHEGGTHFNGEVFVKKLTLYLFYHVVLYGFDHYMDCFFDRYIRTLEQVRKKINIEKNWEVKWVNFYIKIFDLVGNTVSPVCFDKEEFAFLKVVEYDMELIWGEGNKTDVDLLKACHKNYQDMKSLLKSSCTRVPFLKIFSAQFVALNVILAHNVGGEMLEQLEELTYHGFNVDHEYETRNGDDLFNAGDKNDVLRECQGTVEVLNVVHKKVFLRQVNFEDLDLLQVVVEALSPEGCETLRKRCCCKLIESLFEKVVVEGMKEEVDISVREW
ncbi:LAME_0G03070g1_1 [Lachancea meyersii CBS 8951]|uniref:LAME_0G03070g1_1 n=1 Tax=Lachancea meyersii CBS 8951 TaxID=1266667 RepID=A0A1G4K6H2_9SACH|nr:LAME_0G03070g1_1 [Lachancea meyersii CBS 8951]